MTIHVTCECGKQLHAPDEFAGRQTRCPDCKRPVTLPNPETAIQPTPAPPMPAMVSPEIAISTTAAIESPPGGPRRPEDVPVSPATSKLALWSMILGIVSVCVPCFFSIPAVILGILGLRAIGRNPQSLGGKGMAIAGLVAGGVTTVMVLVLAMVAAILFPAVQNAQGAAARITSINNLHQIGIACHVYHDNYNYFPSENAAPPFPQSKLSWRVQILPYILAPDDTLYKEFHQDEPWDSAHNIKLLPRMPKIYLDPRFQSEADLKKGLTYYRGFVGPGGVFGNVPVTISQIQNINGMSNTVLVVEAGEPVPWTKPEDPSFNENSPFGGPKRVPFAALFADAHVQVIPQNFDRKMIGRMINWMNMEPVTLP